MKLIVIGTGYIGISSLIYFTKAKNEIIGIDIDKNKVNLIQQGILPQKDLANWLNFDTKTYLNNVKMYNNFDILQTEKNIDAILIAIPTEKDGLPYFSILENVIQQINNSPLKTALIIIESTVTPGVSDKYLKPYLTNFAIAPRRDWFCDENKTLESLPRVVGGNTESNTQKAISILSSVCKNLYSCNYQEAELIKACENSLRHVGAVFATQLAVAYPNLNTRKILKLASTKWNIPEYYPNILSTSGYCIPISSKYVKMGAENPEALTILDATLKTDSTITQLTTGLIKSSKPKNIGILGMAYLGDIKVYIESGCLKLLKYFRKFDDIQVNDPLYSVEEIKKISKRNSFSLNDLDKYDVLIVTVGHSAYKKIDKDILIEKTKNCKYILDNSENSIWKDINFKCPYIIPGESEWIKKITH